MFTFPLLDNFVTDTTVFQQYRSETYGTSFREHSGRTNDMGATAKYATFRYDMVGVENGP